MEDQETRQKLPGLQNHLGILTVYSFSTAFHKLDSKVFMLVERSTAKPNCRTQKLRVAFLLAPLNLG